MEIYTDDYMTLGPWGYWSLDKENMQLLWRKPHGGFLQAYEVDFDYCNSSAEILDWIIQFSEKAFASREDVGNLVMALDSMCGGIQSHFCGGGNDTPRNFSEIARKIISLKEKKQ